MHKVCEPALAYLFAQESKKTKINNHTRLTYADVHEDDERETEKKKSYFQSI